MKRSTFVLGLYLAATAALVADRALAQAATPAAAGTLAGSKIPIGALTERKRVDVHVTLPATAEWLDTGQPLAQGGYLAITATGAWANTPSPTLIGPGGFGGYRLAGTVVGDADLASLVAKVGNATFAVGSSFTGTSPAAGNLLLGMNDVAGTFGDNVGELAITISFEETAPPAEPAPSVDDDHDGIDDRTESALLARFRPYMLFSLQEGVADEYRPADVWSYVSQSELLGCDQDEGTNEPLISQQRLQARPTFPVETGKEDPIFSAGPIDLRNSGKLTRYCINPLKQVPGVAPEDPGRHGSSWEEARQLAIVGLYGHVVPIKLASADAYNPEHVPASDDPGRTFYKIEYWQFFGFSEAPATLGDHEADWTTVQILYDPDDAAHDGIAAVMHSFHGYEARFDLAKSRPPVDKNDPVGGPYHELQGPHYGDHVYFSFAGGASIRDDDAQNHVLRLFRDPETGAFTHPGVYVEWGTHELYPSPDWFIAAMPNHDGNCAACSYLAAPPPNLGEVEHPLAETPAAPLILRFSGRWGHYHGSSSTDPPQGPPLHVQWTWPGDSSLRWRLSGLTY